MIIQVAYIGICQEEKNLRSVHTFFWLSKGCNCCFLQNREVGGDRSRYFSYKRWESDLCRVHWKHNSPLILPSVKIAGDDIVI